MCVCVGGETCLTCNVSCVLTRFEGFSRSAAGRAVAGISISTSESGTTEYALLGAQCRDAVMQTLCFELDVYVHLITHSMHACCSHALRC